MRVRRWNSRSTRYSGIFAAFLVAMPLATAAVSSITVGGGILNVGSALTAGEVNIGTGATLGGGGTIYGNLTIEGSVVPAIMDGSPANLFVFGDADFFPGSSFHCHATSHSTYDSFTSKETVSGTCVVYPSKESAAVPVGEVIGGTKFGTYAGFSLAPSAAGDWKLESDGSRLLLTDLVGDSDGNGLPDWFELIYFLVRAGTDPGGHGDGDGMTNEEEWIAGTDPTDPASLFDLKLTYLGDDDFRVEWPSVEGRKYSLYLGENVDSRTTPVFEDLSAQPPSNTHLIYNLGNVLDSGFMHGTVRRDTE